MVGIVIFLHGLNGNRETWGKVPEYVGKSLKSFEIVTPEFDGSTFGVADIVRSAEQIKTRIRTSYLHGDPIYLVGYSAGGLVAREIVRSLLITPEEQPSLLSKIAGVITLGSPLCGSVGNPIIRWLSQSKVSEYLPKKVRQLNDKAFVFDSYKVAIEDASKRGLTGPKHVHIEIEGDAVALPHDQSMYTDDDIPGGIVPGVHKKFAESDEDAAYVADVLLLAIRNRQNSLGRASRPVAQLNADQALPERLLLIACSNRKKPGGELGFRGPDPAGWIPQPQLRERMMSKRSNVFSILKDLKLYDGFQRGGNRAYQAPNRVLRHGPDLGGIDGDRAAYRAAWDRYDGRCYTPIDTRSWQQHFTSPEKLSVLIMSGLYGLIDAREWIQEYDVHLTDSHTDTGSSVSSMWSELFTEAIATYVTSAHRDRKVKIFNFLCDQDYVGSIQWQKLPKTCSVYHLSSPQVEDTDLLQPAGVVIDFLLRNPEGLDNVERNTKRYPLSDFGTPPDGHSGTEILFESKFGQSKSEAE